jgi:hypothetical protein
MALYANHMSITDESNNSVKSNFAIVPLVDVSDPNIDREDVNVNEVIFGADAQHHFI